MSQVTKKTFPVLIFFTVPLLYRIRLYPRRPWEKLLQVGRITKDFKLKPNKAQYYFCY